MRLLVMTCLCCLLTVPSLFAQQPASRSEDEAAVREVVRKYINARELRDASGDRGAVHERRRSADHVG